MKALVTGLGGQDAYYLVPYLQSLGYEVVGGYRRSAAAEYPDCERVLFDLADDESIRRAIRRVKPDQIYNLGAQSHVGASFDVPMHTHDVNAGGVLRILECLRGTPIALYQASTSELFGGGTGLTETSPFRPRSPYAVAKLAAHRYCQVYRKAYGVRVSCGILFNHESPRRGREFVTRKIVWHAVRGLPFDLAGLTARRDWGWAPDYVRAMHRMLEAEPDDFVVATGASNSIQDFIDEVARHGYPSHYTVVEAGRRPWDVDELGGDASKIKRRLGWSATTDFSGLVRGMIDGELQSLRGHEATVYAASPTARPA